MPDILIGQHAREKINSFFLFGTIGYSLVCRVEPVHDGLDRPVEPVSCIARVSPSVLALDGIGLKP